MRVILLNSDDGGRLEGLLGVLVAQARQIRNLELAVDGLIVMDGQILVALEQAVSVMLMDDEVGDDALQLQSGSGGDRAGADVSLDGDVVHISHIADLLAFGDTAAVAEVRLDDLDGHILEVSSVLPTAVDALAMGNGHSQFVANILGCFRGGGIGLLIVEDVVLLDNTAQLDSRVGIRAGMVLHDDVNIGTDSLAAGSDKMCIRDRLWQ